MNRDRKNKERAGSGGTDNTLGKFKSKGGKIDSGPTKPKTDQWGEPLNRKSWKGSTGKTNWK